MLYLPLILNFIRNELADWKVRELKSESNRDETDILESRKKGPRQSSDRKKIFFLFIAFVTSHPNKGWLTFFVRRVSGRIFSS